MCDGVRGRVSRTVTWLGVLVLSACSSGGLPDAEPMPSAPSDVTASDESVLTSPTSITVPNVDDLAAPSRPGYVVHASAPATPIDDRLLGTNIPAWLGPELIEQQWFLDALSTSGVTNVRMPGGSWSSVYGWSSCELGVDGCVWDGAIRPSDYARLLVDTGLDGMWTVSVNETAQSAAALVAFFNGEVGDDRVIGVDRNGVDWGTVDTWSTLRAQRNLAEPIGIERFEIGNEVWGGRPESGGSSCASFGWEEVWTCNGTEYVVGNDEHDGYLDIHDAMVRIDPEIEVGIVGVPDPAAWSDWGAQVIRAAEGSFDFYIVHEYGFGETPGADAAARRSRELWPGVVELARNSVPADIPIALTEFNLVSFEAGDTGRAMTQVMNAVFLAESLGDLASLEVGMANHWNFANGVTESGTDYGLVDISSGSTYPAYAAMAAWGRAGSELIDVTRGADVGASRLHATRRDDGTYALIVVHAADASIQVEVGFEGVGPITEASAIGHSAQSGESTSFDEVDPDVVVAGDALTVELGPWSITEIEVSFGG